MATGARPFTGNTLAALFDSILHKAPTSPVWLKPELPAEFEHIVSKALEKDRGVRYQHASDLRADLKRLKRDTDSSRLPTARPLSRPGFRPTALLSSQSAKQPAPKRARWWIFLAGVAGISLIVIIALLLIRQPPSPRVLGSVQITRDGRQKFSRNGMQMIVTDGSRVYFEESVAGGWGVSQVSAVGGETVPVSVPFPNAGLLGISADHSELLVLKPIGDEQASQLWAVPVLGGTPRRLGNIFAHDANWSPDGRQLVYANGNDLYLANADGTEPRKLLALEQYAIHPRFSPDGRKIRFTMFLTKPNSSALWEVSLDSSHLHALLAEDKPAHAMSGSWTTDGRYFVFESGGNIWALRENPGPFKRNNAPAQLTTGPLKFLMPVPSEDGKKLFVIGLQQRAELLRYDSKSGQLQPYLPGIWADELDFSKDGQWVTYVAWPDASLWRCKRDGSGRLQLMPKASVMPRWSPDGKEIAFAHWKDGPEMAISVISKEGGAPQDLISNVRNAVDPVWSPDGNDLAFGSDPWAQFSKIDIKVFNFAGRTIRTLAGSDELYRPRWSPNGRYLAAVSRDAQKLMMYEFTTQKWTELAKTVVNGPEWSRDSNYIYFDNYPIQKDSAIMRIRVADHKIERVLSLTDIRRPDSPARPPWFGIDPDGAPMVARDTGNQEIYALDLELP
jgi:eukaryotic-like serine/threonine-protein kinase